MTQRPFIRILAASLLITCLALSALGAALLWRDSQRAGARYRSQASSAGESCAEVFEALSQQLRKGQLKAWPGATRLVFDKNTHPRWRSATARLSEDQRRRLEWLDDALEQDLLENQAERADQRLASVLTKLTAASPLRDRLLLRWAALKRRLGQSQRALEMYQQVRQRDPKMRGPLGLRLRDVADLMIIELSPQNSAKQLEALLALYERVSEDQRSLDDDGHEALKDRIVEALRQRSQSSEDAAKWTQGLSAAESRDRARQGPRVLRTLAWRWVLESLDGPPSELLEGRLRVFGNLDLQEQLAVSGEPVILALRSNPQGFEVLAMGLTEFIEGVFQQPQARALGRLGFEFSVELQDPSAEDSPTLLHSSSSPVLHDLTLPGVLEPCRLRVHGRDYEQFLAAERWRLILGLVLIFGVAGLACLAAMSLLRAVTRELDAAQGRENFVAAVTHELKTPLASIRLLGELLERGVEPDKGRDFAGRIVREAERLSRLVQQVLAWAQIEKAESASLDSFEDFELAPVVRETVENFRLHAQRQGFELALEDNSEGCWVQAQRDAVIGILINLLDNALKFSDQPHTLELSLALRGREVELRVADRGRGVDPQDRAKIFAAFGRGGQELTRVRPGVGLGLALSRKLARAHQGELSYQPREGGGSVFCLSLPWRVEGPPLKDTNKGAEDEPQSPDFGR